MQKMTKWRSVGMAVTFAAVSAVLWPGPIFAQSGNAKSVEQQRKQVPAPPDPAKERARRLAEYAEAAKVLNGPAGNPECVWAGRRAITLLWRDDLDTAFRHLGIYDRFGCPGAHIKASFRCLVKLGDIDPKQPESIRARVHSCWINPSQQPTGTAAPAPARR